MDKADVVIAQNGDAFDIKILNTRMMINRIPPPSPYKTVDTLKISKKKFAFQKNGLNDICRSLGEGEKVKHRGFALWTDFLLGDTKARAEMIKYCKGDVDLLEKVYRRYLPWITNHPNVGIASKELACPKCGCKNLRFKGYVATKNMQYKSYRCKECFGYCRGITGERYPQLTNA